MIPSRCYELLQVLQFLASSKFGREEKLEKIDRLFVNKDQRFLILWDSKRVKVLNNENVFKSPKNLIKSLILPRT